MNTKKSIKKSLVLSVFLSVTFFSLRAYDFQDNGIFYEIISYDEPEVAVVYESDPGFYGSTSYEGDIVIPSSVSYNGSDYDVTYIGPQSFYNCHNLNSVQLPRTVRTIGWYAFRGCDALKTFFIPNTVTSIVENPFSDCSSLTELILEEGNANYISDPDHTTILTPDGQTILCIAGGVSTYKIPESVINLGFRVLAGCQNLKSLTIPDNVLIIDDEAVADCFNLEEVTIGENVSNIGTNAFYDNRSLKKIVINAKNVPSLAPYGWYPEIWFPGQFEKSGKDFIYVKDELLEQYKTSYGWNKYRLRPISSLGDDSYVFDDSYMEEGSNSGDDEWIWPGGEDPEDQTGMQKIGDLYYLFDESNKTAEVTYELFENDNNYSNLNKVEIPEYISYNGENYQVTSIGKSAFNRVMSLTSITLPSSIKIIKKNAFCETGLNYIEIGDDCEELGYGSFAFCYSLKAIVLGKNIKIIGGESFYQSAPETIVCNALTPPDLSTSWQSVFNYETYNNTLLYVPKDAVKAYREDKYWKDFVNILPIEGSSQNPDPDFEEDEKDPDPEIEIVPESECELVFANNEEGRTESISLKWESGVDLTLNVENQAPITAQSSLARLVYVINCQIEEDTLILDFSQLPDGNYNVHIPEGYVKIGESKINGALEITVTLNSNSAVKGIYSNDPDKTTIYDFSGKKVLNRGYLENIQSLPHGIYIINGKKVLIH